MNSKTVFQHHPVFIYFLLVFLISWIGVYLIAGSRFLQSEVVELSDLGLMAVPMLGAPFGAGILMNYLVDGRKGLNNLFSRMRKWRVSGRWYLPILIFPILLMSVSITSFPT